MNNRQAREDRALERSIERCIARGETRLDLGIWADRLPSNLRELTTLRELTLCPEDDHPLPRWLADMPNLRVLRLFDWDDSLTALPEVIAHMPQLEELEIYVHQITALPEWLGTLPNLRLLDLGVSIPTLPTWLGALPQLEDLTFDPWAPIEVPMVLSDLHQLQRLKLPVDEMADRRYWDVLPPNLRELIVRAAPPELAAPTVARLGHLRRLEIDANTFVPMPDWIGALGQLEALRLACNRAPVMPPWLWGLRDLRELDFSLQRITTIPREIGVLEKLRTLVLRQHQWPRGDSETMTIPAGVFEPLQRLEHLDIANNRLDIPDSGLGDLPNLRYFDIHCSLIKPQPWLLRYPALEHLDIGDNWLRELPPWFGKMTNLRTLRLDQIGLKEVPGPLRELANLEGLCLYGNDIAKLPAWLGELSRLRQLDVSATDLREFPPCIRQMTALEVLELNNTYFSELPSWITELTKLRSLEIDCNKITVEEEVDGIFTRQELGPPIIAPDLAEELVAMTGDVAFLRRYAGT